MNKKFSTLVAALLVSGVSYAVVSQMDGAAVANGVQTTAVADFRALTPEQAQIAADKLTAANIINLTTVPSWKGAKIGAATYNALVTSDGSSYLTLKDGELVLSDDMTATLKTVAYGSDTYLTYDGKYLITNGVVTKVSTSSILADVLKTLAADERLVTMYDVANSQKVALSTDFNGSVSTKNVVLAAELYPSIPTAISVVETPAVAVQEFKATEVGTAGDDPTASAKFQVGEKSNGQKVLKFADNQFLKSTNGVISMVASADEASTVTIDAAKNVSLNTEGDYLVIATADGSVKTSNQGALTGLNKVMAYTTHNGTTAVTTTATFTGNSIYLVYATDENISSGNNKGTFIHFSTKAAESVVVSNAAVQTNLLNMPETMKFAGSTKTLTFTGNDGVQYALKATSDAVGAEVTFVLASATGDNFETAASGALKTAAGKFVTLSGGKLVLAAAEAAEGTQVYAWEQAANKLPVLQKSETSAMDAVTILSTSKTEAPATLVANTSYITYDLTAAQGALMELPKKYYTISETAADNFLSAPTYDATSKTWSLLNEDNLSDAEEQLKSVWIVSTIEDKNGRVTNYAFTNKDNGKKLAFDLKLTAANTWEAVVNPEGKYFEFFVDKQGRVSFVANEKDQIFEGKAYSNANRWYLDITGTTWGANETGRDQLKVKDATSMVVVSDDIDEQINWLNVTAGDGHGFDVIIKNAKGDKIAPVANDLTGKRITAVKGPDLSQMVEISGTTISSFGGTTLEGKLFLMVGGDYKYEAVPTQNTDETALAYQKRKAEQAKKQLNAFRSSKFIVVDTVLYSTIIDDVTKDFYKFAVAEGKEFISATGYKAEYAGNSNNISFDYKTGKYSRNNVETKDFDGLTRSLNNAAFAVSHLRGSEINEPIQVTTAEKPYFYTTAGVKNYQGIFGHTQAVNNYFVAVKGIADAYYVGAHTSPYDYVYAGLNNDVTYTKVNGIVNIYNAKYNNKGEILSNNDTWFAPADINANAPEGQFLVSYDKVKGTFTLTNRESQKEFLAATSLKTVTDKDGKIIDNVYAIVANNIAKVDTIKIVPATDGGMYGGYRNEDATKLKTTIFNLSFKSGVEGLDDVFVTEPHTTNNHVMQMTTAKDDASKFKLVKFEGKKDTVYVSAGSYVTADGKEVQDKVVALTYAIYNEANGEFVKYEGDAAKEHFICDPTNTTDATKAQKFILKEKATGYQLIAVKELKADGSTTFAVADGKVYGAFKANKLSQEENIYKVTDNDIFQITDVNEAIYHKMESAYDSIRIYKAGMVNDQTALYAKTADKSVVSGTHFLAMDHQADVKKASFSFFVDTAYIRDSYKPQYLLAIDTKKANKFDDCDITGHEPHDTNVVDTVYGKFLVSMVDSIPVWGDKHSNPYWFDQKNYARLGFVDAKHLVSDEKLVIVRNDAKLQTPADTISLANNNDKIGAYAFRYVNSGSEQFVIETAYKNQIDGTISAGYIKWLNGTPVIVNDRAIAEVFELKKTETAPTHNDQIGTSEVSVIASTGSVLVKNASGKSVAISNILGQAIVTTVLTSDNATISVPAGIVVVAVEGEEAVKTVVK